jgi:hypothetical protein
MKPLLAVGCGTRPIRFSDPVAEVKVVPVSETLRLAEGIRLYADP